MTRLAALALVTTITALAACRADPDWCEGAPGNRCSNIDAPTDTPVTCASNDQCATPTPVCDLAGSKMCVQCVAPDQVSACSGTTPACGSDNMCRACRAHNECASSACLDDGSCASEATVAYVDPMGTDNTTCTKAMPCIQVAKALATGKPYVKFHGTTTEQVSINNQNVTLLADPGGILTSTMNGILLEVRGSSHVSIFDLSITGGSGTNGFGISMPSGNTALLTLRRVKLIGNAGGGVSISGGEFDIQNTIIAKNGSATSSFGGVFITQANSGTRAFAFNTVANNTATTSITPGVLCAAVATPINLSNSIVFGASGTQVEGSNCSWTYSDIGPTAQAGTGNINADPMFVNAAQGDFHISASSPCKDAADPAATLDEDFDRDTRPQGAARDIGADEVQ